MGVGRYPKAVNVLRPKTVKHKARFASKNCLYVKKSKYKSNLKSLLKKKKHCVFRLYQSNVYVFFI